MQVEPASLRGRAVEIRAELGAEVWRGQVGSGATGVLEFPLAKELRSATISGPPGTWVRVRLRRHGDAPARTEEQRSVSKAAVAPLTRLSALSAELRREKTQSGIDDLRLRRAQLLAEMGYPRYAQHDLSRRGSQASPLPAATPAPRSGPGFVTLTGAAAEQQVVLRGLMAKTPLLAPPLFTGRRAAQWQRVRQLRDSRRHADAVRELLAMGAAQSVARDALALALSAEKIGSHTLAAETYERLAEATDSGALYARAARLGADAAARSTDLHWARRAFYFARAAAVRGEDVSDTLARFTHGLRWETVPVTGLGIGGTLIEVLGTSASDSPGGAEIRRALTLAPAHARTFRRSIRYSLAPWRTRRLGLEYLCFLDEPGPEICDYDVFVDGEKIDCLPREPRVGGKLVGIPSAPHQCEFEAPTAARTLLLQAPLGVQSFGWANLSVKTALGPTSVPARVGYSEISSETPLRLLLAGPAVVELQFRAVGLGDQSLEFVLSDAVDSMGDNNRSMAVKSFNSQADPLAQWPGRAEPLSLERSHELVLEQRKTYELRVAPERGRALLRVRLARVDAAPRPRGSMPEAAADHQLAVTTARFGGYPVGPVLEAAERAPFSYSVESSAVDRDLSESDEDARDRFLQHGVLLRKELVAGRVWANLEGLARLRSGPASWGAVLRSQLSSRGAWPGGYLRAQWIGQSFGARVASGSRVSVGAYQRYPLSSSMAVLPSLGFTVRSVDTEVRGNAAADRDVYSSFGRSRPRTGEAGIALQHRPLVDTFARYGLLARLGPSFDALDQVDLLGRLLSLPGEGAFPWLGLDLAISYRPEYELRSVSFLRVAVAPSATFWSWVSDHHRLRLEAELSLSSDFRSQGENLSRFFGRFRLGYDYLSEPGLSDYAPSDRPFRQRLEEGAPRSYRRAPREEVALGEDP